MADKVDVLAVIRRMGYLQIDTIHVIRRSHLLVLWSRLGDFPPEWVDELLEQRALFEYWAHAMCFLPIEDYPLYRRQMLDTMDARKWPLNWAVKLLQEQPDLIDRIRSHLRQNGAVRSAEFENHSKPPGGWWNWKEEKDALESLFLTGEVMIARRQNFQRVYDLRERVLPDWDDSNVPATSELERTLALRAVRALGIASPSWVSDYFRQPKNSMPRLLKDLAGEGLLQGMEIEELKGPFYMLPEQVCMLSDPYFSNYEPGHTTLLSPFDPLVADRQRARQLFNFDYMIECYTPAAKRRYGYFTLPILHDGRLVGRLDPKAHRAQGIFEVKALYLEPGVQPGAALVGGLAGVLQRLAAWHLTPQVVIRQSDPPEFAPMLSAAIRDLEKSSGGDQL